MKAERSQRAAHEALGIWCKRCSELADVVAVYQHGVSPGYPAGRLEQIPMCARHGKTAIETDVPRPRLIEHEAALTRQAKADRERRRGGQPRRLKLKAGCADG